MAIIAARISSPAPKPGLRITPRSLAAYFGASAPVLPWAHWGRP